MSNLSCLEQEIKEKTRENKTIRELKPGKEKRRNWRVDLWREAVGKKEESESL